MVSSRSRTGVVKKTPRTFIVGGKTVSEKSFKETIAKKESSAKRLKIERQIQSEQARGSTVSVGARRAELQTVAGLRGTPTTGEVIGRDSREIILGSAGQRATPITEVNIRREKINGTGVKEIIMPSQNFARFIGGDIEKKTEPTRKKIKEGLKRTSEGFKEVIKGKEITVGEEFFKGRDPKFKKRAEKIAPFVSRENILLGGAFLTSQSALIRGGSFLLTGAVGRKVEKQIRQDSQPGSLRSMTASGVGSITTGIGAARTGSMPFFLGEFGLKATFKTKETIQSIKEQPKEALASFIGFGAGARFGVLSSRISPRFQKVEIFEGVEKATPQKQIKTTGRTEQLFSAGETLKPFINPFKFKPQFKVKTKKSGLGKERLKFERTTGTTERGFFLSKGKVFSPFLRGKTPAIVEVQARVKSFPKDITNRIKRIDTLSTKQRVKLRADINKFRSKNPGSIFPGQKTSAGLGSEFEFVAPEKTIFSQVRTDPLTRGLNIFGKGSKFTIDPRSQRIIQIEKFEIGKPPKTQKGKVSRDRIETSLGDIGKTSSRGRDTLGDIGKTSSRRVSRDIFDIRNIPTTRRISDVPRTPRRISDIPRGFFDDRTSKRPTETRITDLFRSDFKPRDDPFRDDFKPRDDPFRDDFKPRDDPFKDTPPPTEIFGDTSDFFRTKKIIKKGKYKSPKQPKVYISSIAGILSGRKREGIPGQTSGLGFRLPTKRKSKTRKKKKWKKKVFQYY